MNFKRKGIQVVFRRLLTVLIMAAATLGIGEVLLRTIKPPAKVQVVRGGPKELFMHGEVPIWVVDEDYDRMNLDCPDRHPDARLVVFTGDSIFYGVGMPGRNSFTSVMQESLDREFGEGAWCILNLSQPAYSVEQKYYWYTKLLEKHQPDMVFWEYWFGEIGHFRKIGDSVYNLASPDVDSAPDRLFEFIPGPKRLKLWLFSHSRLFEYFVLACFNSIPPHDEWLDRTYIPLIEGVDAELKEHGGKFSLVVASGLNMSFSEASAQLDSQPTLVMSKFLAPRPFDVVFLPRLMLQAGADYKDVRQDECCHYNEKGHRIMAAIFLDMVKAAFPNP